MNDKSSLNVLLIEDNPVDALLLQSALETDRLSQFNLTHVERLAEGLRHLKQDQFDIALVDLGLPDSSGLETFTKLHAQVPDLPVVVFSGDENEDQAIRAVRAGAQDYLVKGMSGFEMAPRTIRYAIERQRAEEKLAASEKRFRALIENSSDAVAVIGRDGTLIYESPSVERITGFKAEERVGKNSFDNIHPDDMPFVKAKLAEVFACTGSFIHATYRSTRKDGSTWWTESTATNMLNEPGVNGIVVNFRDVTERVQAEQRLRENEALLRQVLESTQDAIFAIDRDYCLLVSNGRHQQVLSETGGHPFRMGENVLSPNYPTEVNAYWRGLYDRAMNGEEFKWEAEWPYADGQQHTIENSFSPLRDAVGTITGALVVIHDITERKQAEQKLRESQENYRNLFENNPHPMWVYDLDTLAFLAVNEAAIAKYGYSREEFLQMTILDIRPAEDHQRLLENVAAVTEGLDEAGSWRHSKKDGSVIDVEITSHTLEFYGRKAEIVLAHDITERKLAEEKIRISERQLQALVTSLDDIVFEVDEHGTYLNVWTSDDAMLFKPREEIIGKRFDEVFGEEASRPFFEYLARTLDSDAAKTLEYPVEIAGTQQWFVARYNPIRSREEGRKTVSILVRNITEHKLAEQALRESQVRTQAMLDAIPDMMFRLDREGVFLDYKAESDDLYAQDRPSLVGLRNRDISPAEFADLIEQKIDETLSTGALQTFEYQLQIPGREVQDYEARMTPSGSDEVTAIVRNVTERKQAEEKIRQSEAQYRYLFENNPHPMWAYDLDTLKFLAVNDSAVEKYGYTREEFLGMTIADIRPTEDVERLLKQLQDPRPALQHSGEWLHILKDGKIINVEISSHTLNMNGHDAALVVAIDITDRKRNETLVYAQRDLAQALGKFETTKEGFRVFLETILSLTGLDGGGIYLFDPEYHSLDLIQYQGLKEEFIQVVSRFAPDSPNVQMILPGIPHYFSSDNPVVQNPMHKQEGLTALAVVPLLYQDRVVGCLNLASHTLTEVPEYARHVLETLSTEIGNFAMHIRSQEALRESETKYRTLITSTMDGVFVAQDETFIFANPALPASLGYDPEEFENIPFEKVLAPEYLALFTGRFRQRIAGGNPVSSYQVQFMNKAGTEKVWFELRANLTTYQGRPAVLGIARDITERKKSERALKESEEFLNMSQRIANMGSWRLDLSTFKADWSENCYALYGFEPYKVEPSFELFKQAVHPDDLRLFEEAYNDLLKNLKDVNYELRIFDKNGRMKWVYNSISPVVENGQVVQFVGIQIDITERKGTEESLRESEERFRSLFENSKAIMFMIDPDSGNILDANSASVGFYGYTYQQFLSMKIDDINQLPPDEILAERQRARQEERNYFIFPHRLANGEVRTVEVYSHPIKIRGSTFLYSIVFDITERKRAEQNLRTSEENFRQIAESIQEVFWIFDNQQQKLVYLNPTYEDIWGISIEDTLRDTRKYIQAIHPDDRATMLSALERQARGEQTEMEYRIVRPDGSIRWIFDRSFPLRAEDGRVFRTTGVATDITERKQAESLLKRRMEDLTLINKLNDAVNHGENLVNVTELLAADAKHIFGSQATSIYLLDPAKKRLILQHFTMSREYVEKLEKLIGRPVPQIDLPVGGDDHFSRALNSEDGLLISGYEGIRAWLTDFSETSFLPSRVRPVVRKIIPSATKLLKINSVISIPLKAAGEVLGLIEFTTEDAFDEVALERLRNVRHQLAEVIIRMRAEQSLRESNEKYRLLSEELEERVKQRTAEVQDLYDNAPTGYHSLDDDGRFIQVNQTELNWLGYSLEELIGQPISRIMTEQSLATFRENFPRFKKTGYVRDLEFDLVRKDGTTFPVLVNATAICDDSGKYLMSRSTVFDNTERKKVNEALRASEAQLRQSRDDLSAANTALEKASRMKDEFLASMSHELRTPLTGILGLSEALQMNTYGELSEKQKKILYSIYDSGTHLLALINDILDLSKVEAGKLDLNFVPCSISDICQASLQLTKGMAHQKNQQVHYSPPTTGILIQADARRLKQVLVNLLSNAVKFTPPGGELGLEVQMDDDGRNVSLTVWDKGIGIKEEDLGRLFQPFTQIDSSLAREYSGTGLGLSLVRRLVELHNGSVQVESVFGKGSRFTVTLPCNLPVTVPEPYMPHFENEEDAEASKHAKSSTQPGVFVVDDAQVTLDMLSDYLTAKRFRVTTARSGLELLRRVADVRPDVIVLDIQMPGMDGMEVIRKIRAHTDPSLASTPIIAVTALAMSGDRERCLEAGANEYMSKPVRLAELTKMIEDLLPSSREANRE